MALITKGLGRGSLLLTKGLGRWGKLVLEQIGRIVQAWKRVVAPRIVSTDPSKARGE